MCLPFASSAQNLKLGQWRDFLSFNQIFAVESGKKTIYGIAKQGIVVYNTNDNGVSTITKVSGLNDINITAAMYDSKHDMLLVGYQNGNIDFVKSDGRVVNMPDIKRASIVADKTINRITVIGNKGYLSCGFGIVTFNLDKAEVEDTYKFGPNGESINVYDLCLNNDSLFAATNMGIFKAWSKSPLLIDFNSWKKETGFTQASGKFNHIESFDGKVFACFNSGNDKDVILEHDGHGWIQYPNIFTTTFNSIRAAEDRIMFTFTFGVIVRDKNKQEVEYINTKPGKQQIFFPLDAIWIDGNYWIGETNTGLIKSDTDQKYTFLSPNGPKTNSVYKLSAQNNHLYVAAGAVNQDFSNNYRFLGIPHYNGSEWTTIDETNDPMLTQATGFLNVTIDPGNDNHAFISSWDKGLIEMENNVVKTIYNDQNSALQQAPLLPGNYRIGASTFDGEGNLWIGESYATNNLVVRRNDGSWTNYKMPDDFGDAIRMVIRQIVVTQDGGKWMVLDKNGLYAYNENSTDVKGRKLTAEANKGGLPSIGTYCIAEDLDGELWIGTDKGFAIIYSPSTAFTKNNLNADQPIIEQDGNYEKILETEQITSIAVDGGNRKWMSTANSGVYLLSEDGLKQILHFTTENSPLLSNEVNNITINQKTGEVYFGTSLGIQSYLSDATASVEEVDQIDIYPNPIRPDYNGPISIRGLVRDSNVKITDISGNLINETTSTGGAATWNGLNLRGERPATGTYLVFVTNEDGSQAGVGKIVLVR